MLSDEQKRIFTDSSFGILTSAFLMMWTADARQ